MMEHKVCTKCGIEKEINMFKRFKSSNGKYYYTGDCKQCRNLNALERNRKYRDSHKEQIAILKKKHYQKNKASIRTKNKRYYEAHKEKIKAYSKEYYERNKERFTQLREAYYNSNKKTILKEKYEYKKNKLRTDTVFRIKERTRNLIRTAFRRKGLLKSRKTEEILGCNLDFFYNYLLETFYINYGYEYDFKEIVDIDHIVPLKVANTEQDVIKLCHYTNLQLLKTEDNSEKSDKLNWKIQKEE